MKKKHREINRCAMLDIILDKDWFMAKVHPVCWRAFFWDFLDHPESTNSVRGDIFPTKKVKENFFSIPVR